MNPRPHLRFRLNSSLSNNLLFVLGDSGLCLPSIMNVLTNWLLYFLVTQDTALNRDEPGKRESCPAPLFVGCLFAGCVFVLVCLLFAVCQCLLTCRAQMAKKKIERKMLNKYFMTSKFKRLNVATLFPLPAPPSWPLAPSQDPFLLLLLANYPQQQQLFSRI